ncbi:cupin domain-containing protein [Methylobacterium phyllosphaerae]
MSSEDRSPDAAPSGSDAPDGEVACLRFEPPSDPEALGRAWQEHIAPVFAVSFRPETDLTIPIAMRSYHLGDLIVGDVMAPAHTLVRSQEMISQQGLDHILLQFYRRGQSLVETDHGGGPVSEVQCIVFDLAQPVRIVAGAVDATNVVIPRALLEKQGCHPDALHGRPSTMTATRSAGWSTTSSPTSSPAATSSTGARPCRPRRRSPSSAPAGCVGRRRDAPPSTRTSASAFAASSRRNSGIRS